MNVDFLPTLQHMASVIIASYIYNSRGIRSIAGEEAEKRVQSKLAWDSIEKKAMDKLSSNLPCPLRTSVAKVIRRMHEEVIQWGSDHEFILDYVPLLWFYKNIRHLYWKSDGTINKTLTAKKLILNEKNDLGVRFVMACTYFFEEDILALWEEVKEDWDYEIINTNQIVRFWRQWLRNGATEPWSEMADSYFSVPHVKSSDIRLRISSFFPFLILENKLKYIRFLGGQQVHYDDFRLCLSHLDETERNKILHSRPVVTLDCFLNWPLQPLFIKMANELMSYLTVKSFKDFLEQMITMYTRKGFEDLELFESFWGLSPDVFKDAVKNDGSFIRNTEYFLVEECQSSSLEKMLRNLLELKYRRL